MYRFMRYAVLAGSAIAISACGLGEENHAEIFNAKYHLFAVDHEGNLNILGDDGNGKTQTVKTVAMKNSQGVPLALGEVQFHQNYAYVVVANGLDKDADDQTAEDHGGVVVINLDTNNIVKIVHLRTSREFNAGAGVQRIPSRIVHTFADPDGKHLWLNNDGYSSPTGAAQALVDMKNQDDSVFRINWDNDDASTTDGDDKFLDVVEIRDNIGNGHKKSAFSYPTTALPNVPRLFATHNLSEQTVSIVDNDATHTNTFLVAETPKISLASNATVTINNVTRPASNTPHGLTFSPASGRFYVGITPGEDMGLAIIDAQTRALSSIPAGFGAGQIPAGGYVHANEDGTRLYMIGYKKNAAAEAPVNRGYLTIIEVTATADTVKQVIDLGDVAPSSFNIAHFVVNGMHGAKALIGSTNKGGDKDVLKIVELDHETGDALEPFSIKTLQIGAGLEHRNGVVSEDGTRAYFPNGGDCGATHDEHGADCTSIAIIDTVNDKVLGKAYTAGHQPGALSVMQMNSAGGHQH